MRLLDRYLLRELLVPLGYCLGGFLIFWMSFDMFNHLGEYQEDGLSLPVILEYYAWRTPEFLVLILPITLLLALLYTLSNHARHHELTAIRAAGVSMARLCLPYAATGFFLSLALFVINEYWAPRAAEAGERLLAQNLDGQAQAEDSGWKAVNFVNVPARRFWTIGGYNARAREMRDLHVVWPLSEGGECTVHASRAVWRGNEWRLHEAQRIVRSGPGLPGAPETHQELTIPEWTETPEQIHSEIKISQLTGARARAARGAQVSIREILNYLALNPHPGPELRSLLFTQLHGRIAEPWTALVVVAIALPFGAASGRRSAFVGVAASVFICFAFFVTMRFGQVLGTGGYVPPWLGAWLPNLLFGIVGVTLTLRLR